LYARPNAAKEAQAATLRASSVSGTVVARMCTVIGGLVAGIVTARSLGPQGRGQYFAVMTAAAIIAQACNFGLGSSNVFLGARDRTQIGPLLGNSVVLAAVVAVVATAIVLIWGNPISGKLGVPSSTLWAIGIIAAATLLWNLGASLLVAEERFGALNLWQIANTVLSAGAIVACALWHGSVQVFLLATSAAALVTAAGSVVTVSSGAFVPVRFSPTLIRTGLGFSVRAYCAVTLTFLLQRSGASLLVFAGNTSELGQYSIASQVADVLLIIPGSIGLVLYPMLVRQEQDLWPRVRSTVLLTTISMLVLCVVAAVVAPLILPLVFGAQYSRAAAALWGLLPSVLAYSIVSVLSQYLVARHYPWTVVMAWVAGLAAALVSGAMLTSSYGAVGAGLSQSLGALLVCVVIVGIARRRRHKARFTA
jgi:O-antigen/teichoic acid export membrane protein